MTNFNLFLGVFILAVLAMAIFAYETIKVQKSIKKELEDK